MTSAEPTATITWKQGATTGTIALCKASEVRGALMAAGAIVSDDISISVKLGRFARTSLYDLLAKEKLQDDPDPLDPQYELELGEPKEKTEALLHTSRGEKTEQVTVSKPVTPKTIVNALVKSNLIASETDLCGVQLSFEGVSVELQEVHTEAADEEVVEFFKPKQLVEAQVEVKLPLKEDASLVDQLMGGEGWNITRDMMVDLQTKNAWNKADLASHLGVSAPLVTEMLKPGSTYMAERNLTHGGKMQRRDAENWAAKLKRAQEISAGGGAAPTGEPPVKRRKAAFPYKSLKVSAAETVESYLARAFDGRLAENKPRDAEFLTSVAAFVNNAVRVREGVGKPQLDPEKLKWWADAHGFKANKFKHKDKAAVGNGASTPSGPQLDAVMGSGNAATVPDGEEEATQASEAAQEGEMATVTVAAA